MIKIAFFDTKQYDMPSFKKYISNTHIEIKFFETKLSVDTVGLVHGFDTVIVFVNDILNL